MPAQQGAQAYESLAQPDSELPAAVARIAAQHHRGWAAARRCRAPRQARLAALFVTFLAAVAGVALWLGAARHPWLSSTSSSGGRLRGGSQLDEELEDGAFCSKLEEDTEFHTQASLYWKGGVLSAELCCAECDGDPECGAWTWGSGDEGLGLRCFLKKLAMHETPKRLKRKGVVSGLPARVLRKHGIIAGILAKAREDGFPSEEAHETSAMCPGDISVEGQGGLKVVAAQWFLPGQHAGRVAVSPEGNAIIPHLASRGYLASKCSSGEYAREDYASLQLLGRTLRYTADVSNAGCGCNAQLKLAAMRSNLNKSACMDYSCGVAASGCGALCSEISVQDANRYAWSTSISVHGKTSNSIGYGGSLLGKSRRDWSSVEYGPRARCIDTDLPFQVAISFLQGREGLLEAVELVLAQEGMPCTLSTKLDKAALGGEEGLLELSKALAEGLTPVVAYEASAGLGWLDGVSKDGWGPCVQDAPEACAASVRFSHLAVVDGTGGSSVLAEESNLPEIVMDTIYRNEAKKRGEQHLDRAAAKRLVDDARGPCGKDCNQDGSNLIQVVGDEVVERGHGWMSDGEFEESAAGSTEWEVVEDRVHILSRREHGSERLAVRERADVVVGKRIDSWIRLLHQPGYVPIVGADNQTVLLKERIVMYEKIVSGNCKDHGLFPIEDPRVCEAAAFSLGYLDTHTSTFAGPQLRPEGCYLYQGALFLDSRESARGNGVVGGRYSICSSAPYRVTSTTTSTVTTMTTMTTTTTTVWGFPSLFCFEVMMRNSYEYGLVRKQIQRKAGIFNCDEYAVFSQDAPFSLGRGPDGPEVKAIWFKKAPVWRSEDNTAANALLFMNVFKAVKKDGRYGRHDWTIKADPDAVVLPWRLRDHLRPVTGQNNFLVNCNKVPWKAPFPMIFGALEAYSNTSLQRLLNGGMEQCNAALNWRMWGEDKYLGNCMKFLGVQPYNNFEVLGDNRCTGADCSSPTSAAFHDFKSEWAWFQCWETATR